MAAKKVIGKIKSNDGGYIAPPGSTNANRLSGAYKDEGISLKQYFDSLFTQTPKSNLPLNSPKAGDALSGRTPDSGTRSLLEGFRSFIGGGLRKHGR